MSIKSFVIYLFQFGKKTAGRLLLFVAFSTIGQAKAQSYYYFESSIDATSNGYLKYYTFLILSPDGTATARILYKNPVTGEQKLVEQQFIDSVEVTTADDSRKYLYPTGNAVYINSPDDSSFRQPRFVFQKQQEGSNIFYTPFGIEQKIATSWAAGELIVKQEKTFTELSGQQDFVSLFYSPADELYGYFLNLASRGGRLGNEEQKTRLFLLAVADTNDATIGTTSAIDLAKVTETFTTMAGKLGIQIVQRTLAGSSYGKRNTDNAIDRWLTPKPNDIVIFYYSGHGFRYTDDVSNYPRMDLRTKDDIDYNNLSIESVYSRILKKKAKVTIVISDCCNDDIKKASPLGRLMLRSRSLGSSELTLNLANCRALFFPERPLSFIATAADKTQLAVGNPQLGGFFTNYFMANLSKTIYGFDSNASWFSIFRQTQESTARQSLSALCNTARCVQTAVSNVTPF